MYDVVDAGQWQLKKLTISVIMIQIEEFVGRIKKDYFLKTVFFYPGWTTDSYVNTIRFFPHFFFFFLF